MTVPVPGFDDDLTEALVAEAAAVGESVDAFVARAVAARMILERTRRSDPGLERLLARIAESGLSVTAIPRADPPEPLADPARLEALYDTGLLDAAPDAAYDRIVGIAAEALAVPTAAVSLVDHNRQYLFSAVGLSGELEKTRQTSIEESVCRYVVNSGEPLIVEDARSHPLLRDHPTVVADALLSYAGIPLTNDAGKTIGTLCVWDSRPRQWSSGHVQILQDLAGLVRRRIFGSDG